MIAKDFIEQDIPLLDASQKVASALQHMNEERLSQLVLADDGLIMGILDEAILFNYDEQTELSLVPLKFANVSVSEEMHFLQLADYLIDKDLAVCPVLNFEQKYIGSVRATDVYKKVLRGQFSGDGAIIVLEIKAKDYRLSDISRIAESEGVRIERLYLAKESENEYQFVIKFNKKEIERAINSLKRFGYNVVQISATENRHSLEKDRYGLLMKYLEI